MHSALRLLGGNRGPRRSISRSPQPVFQSTREPSICYREGPQLSEKGLQTSPGDMPGDHLRAAGASPGEEVKWRRMHGPGQLQASQRAHLTAKVGRARPLQNGIRYPSPPYIHAQTSGGWHVQSMAHANVDPAPRSRVPNAIANTLTSDSQVLIARRLPHSSRAAARQPRLKSLASGSWEWFPFLPRMISKCASGLFKSSGPTSQARRRRRGALPFCRRTSPRAW